MENQMNSAKTSNLFFSECCSSSELEMINKNSSVAEYNKGEVIFKQNTFCSNVIYLESGLVKLYEDKKKMIYKFCKPNNFIGMATILDESAYQYSAAAIDRSVLHFIDKSVFKKILNQNNAFAVKLLRMMAETKLYILKRFWESSFNQLNGKLAGVLLYLSDSIYESDKYTMPLNQRELGEMIGTSRESLSRLLRNFRYEGIIRMQDAEIEILNKDLLRIIKENG